jgi:hypothetical protein
VSTAEARPAAAHSGTSLPQPPSSTDADDITVIPVRETLPPLGAQRLNTKDRELAGRNALVSFWPNGLGNGSVPRDQLGLRFNKALMSRDRSLMDLGTAVLVIEEEGHEWRELEQGLRESPVDFIMRVIDTGMQLRSTSKVH